MNCILLINVKIPASESFKAKRYLNFSKIILIKYRNFSKENILIKISKFKKNLSFKKYLNFSKKILNFKIKYLNFSKQISNYFKIISEFKKKYFN